VEALSGHLAGFPAVEQEIPAATRAARLGTRPSALVFTDDHGQPLRRTAFSPIWRCAVRAVGAPKDTTFHDLRH
jgi:hypothetical protein